MRRYILTIVAVCLSVALMAETKENMLANRHEFRIGIGDDIMSGFVNSFHGEPGSGWPYGSMTGTEGKPVEEVDDMILHSGREKNSYVVGIPHVFAEYMYRVNTWFGVGVQTDIVGGSHTKRRYNNYGDLDSKNTDAWAYWSVFPVARFTYLHKEKVSLYSHVGVGPYMYLCSNGAQAGAAISVSLLGINMGREHWFCTIELGGYLLTHHLLFPDRLLSVSAGYRF